ncbi:type II toxin-antitoxin system VapC family toxin [Synechococcus sp. CCY9201]|uniref:type II toxin-antitoxin system VapC family toxin n=1 Tax=Synechococcus sp. CCY9201 TaxID=174697 RepID=UPI002B2196DD|nr:type II toxin-antitoxin system VapC family toxin [Synechococcus sp. CCY9201]MEA5474670.1 type II toxin-antitoxin system VapC family toxin [Synechococcus sp. CCY9201]
MSPTAWTQSDVFVLDTSALLRLYLADGPLPPSLEPVIQRGCGGDALLLIPDLCLLECASVLLKQVQRQLLSADESRAILADVLQLPLRHTSASDLAVAALDQAMAFSLSVYDASYLALALKHGAQLITADKQLAKAAASLGCLADSSPLS